MTATMNRSAQSSTSTPVSTHTHLSSQTSLSTPGSEATDEVWDLLDALGRMGSGEVRPPDGEEMTSIEQALAFDPVLESPSSSYDGAQFEDIPHFPPLADHGAVNGVSTQQSRTSEPISEGVSQNEEQGLLELANVDRFEQLLKTQMGLVRFEQWVDDQGMPGSKQLLRYYKDIRASVALVDEVKAVGAGLDKVYFGRQDESLDAFSSLSFKPQDCLPALSSASLGMHSAQTAVTQKLYALEFKRFIAGRLTEQAKARLRFVPEHDKRGDLGEVFCIADPRLPDQPLVLISDGFCRLSEYPRNLLIGRNCRFLQGPETDKATVQGLRAAIEAGQDHCCLLLNYTRTGRPFWNLLNMIQLRNASGAVEYLLGAQIDVTKAMSGRKPFETLQDLAKPAKGKGEDAAVELAFSPELVKSADTELERPSALRQISQLSSPLLDKKVTSVAYQGPPASSDRRGSMPSSPTMKTSKWLSKLVKTSPTQVSAPKFSSETPVHIRDRISTFSAAHSKLIIFDAKCGLIQYVTPSLLSYLRYPIRSHKDRLSSRLLRMDISDVLTGASIAETDSIKSTIRNVVSNQTTHSIFAGLLALQGGDEPNDFVEVQTANGTKHARISLLHFTPVKDGRDKAQMYVVVVG
ncbi:hypothetical protein CI109_107421 [Kwoniella shandongensis]|uniref:Uncharacterized protein n=1 Tax=Kwoniella shandongensis TaxID=1734106 RepID=A0A5M6BZP3_9TREE|nr:uncharacterized protein CI109_004651 [Kwoniella shandongensis]KAA5526875.1 hypothetical protein CI109_004651 [Kwoniella shandongensis]